MWLISGGLKTPTETALFILKTRRELVYMLKGVAKLFAAPFVLDSSRCNKVREFDGEVLK